MCAWLGRMPWALVWPVILAGWSNASAAQPTEFELRDWIRDLGADSFNVREAAARQLTSAGAASIPMLSECVQGVSSERAWRASAVLAAIEAASSAEQVSDADETSHANETAACSDDVQPPFDPMNLPPAPAPPPEADLAQALAPPPEPIALEAVVAQVLIADAYVSPQLLSEEAPVQAGRPVLPPAVQPDVPRTVLAAPSRVSPLAVRNEPSEEATGGVTFVRYAPARQASPTSRENPPRFMNVLQRARVLLGISAR